MCGVRPTLALLGSLIGKSLVTLDESGESTRYRLLETVRLYAQEQLVEAGEAADTRDAHRDWYLSCTEEVPLDALLETERMAHFLDDQANLRAAMDWSAGQGRSDLVARQLLPISMAWTHSTALIDEASRSLRRVAESPQLEASIRADAMALFAFVGGYGERRSCVATQVRGALLGTRRKRSTLPRGRAHVGLASRRCDRGRVACRSTILRPLGAWYAACSGIAIDLLGSLTTLEEVASELDPAKNGWDRGATYQGLVVARLILDDADRALEDAHAFVVASDGYRDALFYAPLLMQGILEVLALAHLGRFDDARTRLLDVTRTALRTRHPLFANDCLVALAYITSRQGDAARAASLLEPVLSEGRMRMVATYPFVFWFLGELHAALSGVEVDPPLPSVAEATAHVMAINTGAATQIAQRRCGSRRSSWSSSRHRGPAPLSARCRWCRTRTSPRSRSGSRPRTGPEIPSGAVHSVPRVDSNTLTLSS